MKKICSSIVIIIAMLTQYYSIAQNLLLDLKQVSASYASKENYRYAWDNYLIDRPAEKESYTFIKCDNQYLLESTIQLYCINGSKQILFDKESKTAYYAESVPFSESSDPMAFIGTLLQHDFTTKLVQDNGSIRQYHCQYVSNTSHTLDLWVDYKQWQVKKVIETDKQAPGGGFAFELKEYSAYCDAGPEINLTTYLQPAVASTRPTLTNSFSSYKLIILDESFTNSTD